MLLLVDLRGTWRELTYTQVVQRNPGFDFAEVMLSSNPVPLRLTQVPTVLAPVRLRPKKPLSTELVLKLDGIED
jgi:hypothetical protein